MDAAAAERLLAGEGVGFDDLSHVLAAAAAPPRPGELSGETAALVAFRYAKIGASRPPVPAPARTLWPRLARVKTAFVAFALVAAGVALAAGTGVLPTPFTADPSSATGDPTSDRPRDTPGRAGPGPGAGVSGGATASASAAPPTTTASAALVRMCRNYEAKKRSDPDKALDSPSLRPLIEAAGGRDNVDGYCQRILATSPDKPTKSPRPPPPPHPSGPPANPGGSPSSEVGEPAVASPT